MSILTPIPITDQLRLNTETALLQANKNGEKFLEQTKKKENFVYDLITYFNIIKQAIPDHFTADFYRIMIDMLEFFSVDFDLIYDVIKNCFDISDEHDKKCLIFAHHRYRIHHFALLSDQEKYIFFPNIHQLSSSEDASEEVDFIHGYDFCVLLDTLVENLHVSQLTILKIFKEMAEFPRISILYLESKKNYIFSLFQPLKFVFEHVEKLHALFLEEKQIRHTLAKGLPLDATRNRMFTCRQLAYSLPQTIAVGQVICALCYSELNIYETSHSDKKFLSIIMAFAHIIIYKIIDSNALDLHVSALIYQIHNEIYSLVHDTTWFSFGQMFEITLFLFPIVYLIITHMSREKVYEWLHMFRRMPVYSSIQKISGEIIKFHQNVVQTGIMMAICYHKKSLFLLTLTLLHSGLKYNDTTRLMIHTEYVRWFHKFDYYIGTVFHETLYSLQLRENGWTNNLARKHFKAFLKDVETVELATEAIFESVTIHNPLRFVNPLHSIAYQMREHHMNYEREKYIRTNPEMQLLPETPVCVSSMRDFKDYVSRRSTEAKFSNEPWHLKTSRASVEKIIKLL